MNDQILYHTATFAIALDPEKNEQTYFIRHSEDIISLAVDATGAVAATGQVSQFAENKNPSI